MTPFDYVVLAVIALSLLVGVNVVLAVSLNIVNGMTGQFSIGHAGFMSLGAYGAAIITTYCGHLVGQTSRKTKAMPNQSAITRCLFHNRPNPKTAKTA